MFENFLEERISNNEHPQVLFFNESIIAKKNRSKLTGGGKKKKTPFLDDVSETVSDVLEKKIIFNCKTFFNGLTYLQTCFIVFKHI